MNYVVAVARALVHQTFVRTHGNVVKEDSRTSTSLSVIKMIMIWQIHEINTI